MKYFAANTGSDDTSSCKQDALALFDTGFGTSKQLGVVCDENDVPRLFRTGAETALIKFQRTNYMVNFSLHWEKVAEGCLPDTF